MKKFAIIAFAALMVVAFTVPAAALENEFGGYWRTRGYVQDNFTGESETEARDLRQIDTRTRIYYTAKLHDDLKLVNKFEMDAVFGGQTSYGDLGADGINIEVKNTYAEFNIGSFMWRVGVQPWLLARGLVFDTDAAGFLGIYLGETVTIPFATVKVLEGGAGLDANDDDLDVYAILPIFSLSEQLKLWPYIVYIAQESSDLDYIAIGFDLDYKTDAFALYFTGIMETGDLGDADFSGYMFLFGGSGNWGSAGIRGQFFYCSGDDDATDDTIDTWMSTGGDSYYWAEIMGLGTFDNQTSNASPADQLGNIWAANFGVTFKPADKVTFKADLWYAQLAEDDANDNSDLGTEIDLKLTYELVENLNLDVIAAMLFAGDSTTMESDDDANPVEIGYRLSLSF